jgi:hypothetical protein
VDRLLNGNILVTQAHNQSPDGPRNDRTSILEIEPVSERVVWRLRMDSADDGGYRAARIDPCAIFANEAYCSPER